MNSETAPSTMPAVPGHSPHQADPSAEAFRLRYHRQMAYLKARLGTPAADEVYAPDEERLAVRPRLHFGSVSVADLRRRAADPRYAPTVARVHVEAARVAGSTPPATVGINDHDPNRPFADSLAWMAMSVLIDPDDGRRQRTLDGLFVWLRAMRGWGPFESNLPLAQSTISLSLVYDWLYDILPADERAALRGQLIAHVRLQLDETRGGLTMWRGQRFAANHNWAHHSARAFAALALWGDADAPLVPGELKAWLDDALVDFWIVKHTHSSDGAPMEGPCYQDYGLRFYTDFIVQTESLLRLRESFFDDGLRALSVRLFTLLPGNRASMVYADGISADWWGSCSNFRCLAKYFQDARMQLMGEIMVASGDPRAQTSWRDLFHYDPNVTPARLDELPLAHDMADFGLYTARSDWGAGAAFFGLRCGPASAESVVRTFGSDFGEAHLYPAQGDFCFQCWGKPVIPGCEYPSVKLTSNHHLVVFEGRDTQAGREVGQLGEGGAWFNANGPTDADADYDHRARLAKVVAIGHDDALHHYLCDLGGLYRLRDERVPGGVFFPEYWRSLVFLPDGAVAIVDRVRVPVERTVSFRLLTAAGDLAVQGEGFGFTHWGVPSRIDDFSPSVLERRAGREQLSSQENSRPTVATLRAENVREVVFAVILGVGPAAFRYRLATDARGYALTGSNGNVLLRVDWPGV